jgi:hypothetical protein
MEKPMENTETGTGSFGTVAHVIQLLEKLSPDEREHVIRTVLTWFRMDAKPKGDIFSDLFGPQPSPSTPQPKSTRDDEKFSNRAVSSPKEFVFEKNPTTESERLACLAFYLTHYTETPHFKTLDLSRLNTEAAQRKLSNPTVAVNNAVRDGFLVESPKDGHKQLSAMGERFVQLLPNREEALKIKQRMAGRRARKSSGDKQRQENEAEETQTS